MKKLIPELNAKQQYCRDSQPIFSQSIISEPNYLNFEMLNLKNLHSFALYLTLYNLHNLL